jgi:hypothetical protein
VGGIDQFSHWRLPERVSAVGAAGVALIDAAFPGQSAEAGKRAGDGAAVDGAGPGGAAGVRRVQVDREEHDRTRRREYFGSRSCLRAESSHPGGDASTLDVSTALHPSSKVPSWRKPRGTRD